MTVLLFRSDIIPHRLIKITEDRHLEEAEEKMLALEMDLKPMKQGKVLGI